MVIMFAMNILGGLLCVYGIYALYELLPTAMYNSKLLKKIVPNDDTRHSVVLLWLAFWPIILIGAVILIMKLI